MKIQALLSLRPWLVACLIAVGAAALAAAPEEDFKAGEASYNKGDIVGAMPPLKRAARQLLEKAASQGHVLSVHALSSASIKRSRLS
jgi:hypothetical protein